MTSTRPKNVLFIWTDEQRPDTIGAYGNARIETPHIDRLAAGSVVFENAYCAQPVCSPSRASALTGYYPHAHGILQNNMMLTTEVPTLAERVRPAGYACGYVGKWHLGNELGRAPPGRRGFDEFWVSTEDMYTYDHAAEGYSSYHQFLCAQGYTPPDEAHGGRIFNRETAARLPEEAGKPAFQAAECIRFLETYRHQPFLLAVNFLEPHFPFFGPLDDYYPPDEMALPESWSHDFEESVPRHYHLMRRRYLEHNPHVRTNDRRGWQELKARYWGLCTLIDRHVGRVLRRLDELGLAGDTIVVYSSDHGDMMGEHRLVGKCLQFEGAVRVPLLLRVPGIAPKGIATPVSLVHLTPTLLDLLEQPVPPGMHGRSLRPLLTRGDLAREPAEQGAQTGAASQPSGSADGRGGAQEAWDVAPDDAEVVVEWNGWNALPAQIWRAHWQVDPVAMETGHSPVDARTIRRGRWKLTVYVSGEREFYDLQRDPDELHNAVEETEYAPVIRTLYRRLLEWQRETDDPLALLVICPNSNQEVLNDILLDQRPAAAP